MKKVERKVRALFYLTLISEVLVVVSELVKSTFMGYIFDSLVDGFRLSNVIIAFIVTLLAIFISSVLNTFSLNKARTTFQNELNNNLMEAVFHYNPCEYKESFTSSDMINLVTNETDLIVNSYFN